MGFNLQHGSAGKPRPWDLSCAIAGLLDEHNRYPASVAIYPLDAWLWGRASPSLSLTQSDHLKKNLFFYFISTASTWRIVKPLTLTFTIIYNHLHISIEVTKPYWKPHPIPPSHGPSPHPPTCPTRRSPGSSCSTGWLLHPPRRARCRATSGPCSSWCRGGNVRAATDWGRCGGWRGKLMETQIFPWSIGLKLFKSQYLRVKIKETSLEHQNISSKFRLYI